MPAILFAIISYLGWGVGDLFGTVASKKIGGYSITVWNGLFSVSLFSLYLPFALKDLAKFTPELFLITVIAGIFSQIGFLFFYRGLEVGMPSLVGTIAGSFAAPAALISIFFFGEKINLLESLAIIAIFVGLILSTIDFRELKTRKVSLGKGVLFGLLAALSWGIWAALLKIPADAVGWFWPIYIGFSLFFLVFLFMKFMKIKNLSPIKTKVWKPLLASVLLVGIGEFSYNFAISKGLVSLVAPIAGSYSTLFVLLAFIFFKDRLNKQQILGIITTLVGIVLLSFFSV